MLNKNNKITQTNLIPKDKKKVKIFSICLIQFSRHDIGKDY